MKLTPSLITIFTGLALSTGYSQQVQADDAFFDALSSGKAKVDFRLRYEDVSQDNAVADASALTFRTRIAYTSGSLNGWSGTFELEDNRIVLGQGDYTVGPTGYNLGEYSVIADPEFTELDQAFIQYKSDAFTFKLGRQVIALDGHRFIGHVGWRQDRQTFDAATLIYAPNDKFSAHYSYVTQRNRIFGEAADFDSKDHLLNLGYKTAYGTLKAYSYLLEIDETTDNALDTYGVSFKGATKAKDKSDVSFLYGLEFATQTAENDAAGTSFDATYTFAEIGAVYSGVTAKLAYEVLGSDDGNFGFATPLATLHKFNGWTDQFLGTPAQGLVDTSVSFSGKAGPGKWLAVYHDFSADESSDLVDDLGSEINLQYSMPFAKHYTAAIKYATYSGESGRVDADKLWLWVSTKF
ncbi:alginate export family protein [Glaciecola sp. MH2013]|uniref:alginate export family protein n=1 Tax=Glaciecola sp. MH2013 TaxID=2785524 RepID=UPI00189F2184|nr:alginate export family protein [Glaciecola sp. MH2013]MBF7073610.1 alginate export family protein [Glaciecola sp. MH2013]